MSLGGTNSLTYAPGHTGPPISPVQFLCALKMSSSTYVTGDDWKLTEAGARDIFDRYGVWCKYYPILCLQDSFDSTFNVVTLSEDLRSLVRFNIREGELIRSKIQDKFSPTLSLTTHKLKVNDYLAHLLQCFRGRTNLLVLDDESFLSSRAVVHTERCKNIWIPNPRPDMHVPRHLKKKGVSLEKKSLYEFLRDDFVRGTETTAWFDYCCSLTGSTQVKPHVDMDLFFAKARVHRFFGVTFSCRGATKASVRDEAIAQVQRISKNRGYELNVVKCFSYGTVVSVFFSVQ